jgi:hypothetical protein
MMTLRFAKRLPSAQTVAFEFDPMGVVNDTVKNGVSDCWIANNIMPLFDGNLACDQKRTFVAAIIDNLEKVAARRLKLQAPHHQ